MVTRRNKITIDMLEAARVKGWSISQTARHYGTHHTTIGDACKRLGVELPRNQHISSGLYDRKEKLIAEASDVRTLTWSCSPEAIQKALARRVRS